MCLALFFLLLKTASFFVKVVFVIPKYGCYPPIFKLFINMDLLFINLFYFTFVKYGLQGKLTRLGQKTPKLCKLYRVL